MKRELQFAGWLMVLGMGAALSAPSFAQKPRLNGAANRQDNKPPKPQSQPPRQQPPPRQPPQNQPPQRQQQQQEAQNGRETSGANRPPNSNANRTETAPRPNNNPNRPPSAYTPPPRKEFNNLSPLERQKVLENNRRLQNLPPAQRQELQERAQVWNKLTPEQRQHIRYDVLPRWQQLPPDRK